MVDGAGRGEGPARTPVDDGFEVSEGPAGRMLRARQLQAVAPHAFTTRDVSFRGPTADVDYGRLGDVLGVRAGAIVRVSQVHGRTILTVSPGVVADPIEADAI